MEIDEATPQRDIFKTSKLHSSWKEKLMNEGLIRADSYGRYQPGMVQNFREDEEGSPLIVFKSKTTQRRSDFMGEEANSKIFFGYWVVAGAWLAMFVCAGAQWSLSIFMPSLLKEFGWTRTNISLGLTLNMIIMPIAGLVAGYLVDRIGPKWTIIFGGIICSISMALLSRINQIWEFIVLYGVILSVGISLAYIIATVSTVRRWFMKRAALMVAIAMTGSGFGSVILVPLAHSMISAWGWRNAYICFSVIVLVGATVGGLLHKKDPESAGTYPDGVKPDPEEMKMRADFMARGEKWSMAEAFKTDSWWLFVISHLGYLLAVVGLLGHMITWGSKDIGIPIGTMVKIFSFVFVMSGIIGRLVSGFVSDLLMRRFGLTRKPFLYLCTFGIALGMFVCPFVNTAQALVWVSILIGFSYGCGMALFLVYLGDLFGVVSLPALMGVMGLFGAVFAALGPVIFALSYDKIGSYNTAFILSGILCILCGITLFFLKQPKKKTAEISA